MDALIRGRLIDLRRLTRADAPSIYRHCRDTVILKSTGIPFSPYRLQHAEKFVRRSHLDERKKIAFHRGLVGKQSGEIVGMISLFLSRTEHRSAEVGYWLGKTFWGSGYMSEALQLTLRLGFRQLGLNRIYAGVFPGNDRSCHMLERAGFVLEGQLRKCKKVRNRITDLLVYSLLREEYTVRSKPV